MGEGQTELSREQRQLLQLVYETFKQSSTWPSYLYVEQRLDQSASADLF